MPGPAARPRGGARFCWTGSCPDRFHAAGLAAKAMVPTSEDRAPQFDMVRSRVDIRRACLKRSKSAPTQGNNFCTTTPLLSSTTTRAAASKRSTGASAEPPTWNPAHRQTQRAEGTRCTAICGSRLVRRPTHRLVVSTEGVGRVLILPMARLQEQMRRASSALRMLLDDCSPKMSGSMTKVPTKPRFERCAGSGRAARHPSAGAVLSGWRRRGCCAQIRTGSEPRSFGGATELRVSSSPGGGHESGRPVSTRSMATDAHRNAEQIRTAPVLHYAQQNLHKMQQPLWTPAAASVRTPCVASVPAARQPTSHRHHDHHLPAGRRAARRRLFEATSVRYRWRGPFWGPAVVDSPPVQPRHPAFRGCSGKVDVPNCAAGVHRH